jgi:hypothetical protein
MFGVVNTLIIIIGVVFAFLSWPQMHAYFTSPNERAALRTGFFGERASSDETWRMGSH